MQLTSFAKTLLGVGAGVAVVGSGVGLLVARHQRKENAEVAYRATPVSVDEFVDRTITAFDRGTYPSPLADFDDRSDEFRKLDGKLHVGVEDVIPNRRVFHPELVSIPVGSPYSHVITGRDFIRAADADKDGIVTRDELVAAVTPYAGDDGMLDEAERRRILTDGKLAVVVDGHEQASIAGWESNSVVTAHEAAYELLRRLRLDPTELNDDGSPAIRISDVAPLIPWAEQGTRMGTGPITSLQPGMSKIDAAGNGNGLLSIREVANWLVRHHGDDSLVHGHLTHDPEHFDTVLEPQQIGRIDASTLDGHVYYAPDVSTADVDRFYGGSIPDYLDAVKGFREFRGGAEWEPDPAS